MDIVSYNYADRQSKRIKKFIENPDSNSGVVTVPKVIGAGDSVTIPSGRVAVLPNVQVDGEIIVEAGGEVFVPAGAVITLDYIVLKSATKYWKIKVDDLGVVSTEEVTNG